MRSLHILYPACISYMSRLVYKHYLWIFESINKSYNRFRWPGCYLGNNCGLAEGYPIVAVLLSSYYLLKKSNNWYCIKSIYDLVCHIWIFKHCFIVEKQTGDMNIESPFTSKVSIWLTFAKETTTTSMIIIKLHKNHIILGKHIYQAINLKWLIVKTAAKKKVNK